MRKKLSYLVVIAVAALLSLPVQAQTTARKAAQPKVFRTGLITKQDLQKAKAVQLKKAEAAAFAEVKSEGSLAIDKAAKEADTTVGKSFAKWNWAAHATPKFVPQNRPVAKGLLAETHKTRGIQNAFDGQHASVKRAATVDTHGIITAPDDGETKYYTRAGTAYYYSGGSVYSAGQSGNVTIVEAADGTVYIKDIISRYSQGSWVKGTKEGNTITVAAGQPVAYNTTYSATLSVNWGNYDESTEDGWNRAGGDITFAVDEEAGTISLVGSNENLYIGVFWDDDDSFTGYGDYETVWTIDNDYVPPSEELVELPEGAEVQTWYREQTNSTNTGSTNVTGTDVKVAFVGSDVYVAGVFSDFPEAWIKGTVDGTNVTFAGEQFIGYYGGSTPIWAYGTDGSILEDFTMTYDVEAQTLTSVNQLLGNAAADRIYYLQWISSLMLFAEEPAPAQIDVLPYSNDFSTDELRRHFSAIDANGDLNTWGQGDENFTISYADANDDWLVSPAIKLVAGKTYHFAVDSWVRSSNYPESFEVKAATEATAEALAAGVEVIAQQAISNTAAQTFENNAFTVEETGYYYIGIHNTSVDQWTQYVDNFLIEAAPITAPYTGDFSLEETFTDFSVLDANGDANTWNWNTDNGAYYRYSTTSAADDYLILPIKLEAGKNYNVIVSAKCAGASYPEKFEVKVGKEATVEGLNITAIGETTVGNTDLLDFDGTFSADEEGVYYVAIHAISDADMFRLDVKKIVIEEGAAGNAPAAPADFTVTPMEDQIGASIAFSAPTTAIDGSELAAGDIAKIELLRDGNVITTFEAPNPGDALTFDDVAADLTAGYHKYQAISYSSDGVGGKTEEVTVFLTGTLSVPYYADFTVAGTFDLFQVIDNNNDENTWSWTTSYFASYGYSSENAADDYLVTMPIFLEAGKNYRVTVNAKPYSTSYNERFEVVVGKEASAAGLNITAIAPTDVTNEDYEDFEGEFSVSEDGKYFVAIHAISDADMWRLLVSKLSIEKGAEPTAPAAVADFTAVAGEEGALEVNIAYTAPTTAIDGSALAGDVDMKLYRDNALLNTMTMAPGTEVTFKDTEVENGNTYTYYVVGANASGDGQKSEKVSVFVGIDELGTISNFVVASTTASTITFTWDEIMGLNGGYVDVANVEYSIYSMAIETDPDWGFQYLVADEKLGTVTGETTATVDFPVDEGTQQYKYFGISAKTATTEESDPADAYTYTIVGAPEELPIEEGFAGSAFHYNWNTNGSAYVSEDATDGDGVAVELLTFEGNETIYFQIDKVNLNGAANPTIIFDVKSDNISSIRVYGSADGAEPTVLSTVNISGDYTTVKVPLTGINGERFSTVGFEADFVNASVEDWWSGSITELGDFLIIDNIKIMDLLEYNLTADITAPKSVVAGKEAMVKISIRNMGDNAAEGYTVKLFAGDEEIELDGEFPAIESFETNVIEATYAPTIFTEAGTVTLRAEVEYELDLDDDDNVVETNIEVTEPAAMAPESLTATAEGQKAVLEWTVAEGEGTESFTEGFDDQETYPEFDAGGLGADVHTGTIGEWTVVDGNNGLWGYGINGIDVPSLGSQNAWIVMNPTSTQLSQDLSSNYAANSPEQYMISVCVAEPEGAPDATDHWLISPELPGVAQTISFQQRIMVDTYGAETFEVLASSTDKETASFTKVADFTKSNTSWEEVTVDLPEGTKYFAIRHTSTDIWGLMIDDVTFMVSGSSEATAFNIYVDEVLVGSVEGGVLTFTTDVLPEGEHKVSVTALYGDQESRPIDATVVISEPTAIEEIINADSLLDIYNLNGIKVRKGNGDVKQLQKGAYIINNKKVTVK